MSMPAPQPSHPPVTDLAMRNDTLRMIMEWITDRFADAPEADGDIEWEDGEEHDEPHGPAVL